MTAENMTLRINSLNKRPNAPWARGVEFPRSFAISRKTFRELEEWQADNIASAEKAKYGLDLMMRLCILVTKAEVQKRSFGPVAPNQRSNPALAYKIPVQRITGRYFAGWQVVKTARGWMLKNDEIEAYLIETGLYQRVRRPILKMSVISMLRFIQTTGTADHFADWVFAPRRSSKGQFQSFAKRIQPFLSSTGMAGPQGRLPG